MKKIVMVLLASFTLLGAVKAEVFQMGIKGGIGFSSLQINEINDISSGADVFDLMTGDGVMAYHVGLQTRIKIAMLFVQPELYFNDGGGTLEQVTTGGIHNLMTVDFKRIDLPVLLGTQFGPLRINLGPVGSYIVQESIVHDLSHVPEDYTIFSEPLTWGFQAGLGVDISRISLDVRYEGSLSKLGETLTIGGTDFQLDARPRQWAFPLHSSQASFGTGKL